MTHEARPGGGPIVLVDIDGRRAMWCAGRLYGDEELVREARLAAVASSAVPLHPFAPPVIASLESPLGAAAALASYMPGRARIVEAPGEVWDRISVGGCLDPPDSEPSLWLRPGERFGERPGKRVALSPRSGDLPLPTRGRRILLCANAPRPGSLPA